MGLKVIGIVTAVAAVGLTLALALGLGFAACGPAGADRGGTLTVFAAASLGEAFGELGEAFEVEHPGVTVRMNFAGSQTLRTQLEHGAMADVFASANREHIEQLEEAGLLGSAPAYFAANRLAVIAPVGSDAVRTLTDLARPGISVAIASEEAPAGAYAREALERMRMAGDAAFGEDYAGAVLANVVSAETSVRGVAQKVALGEVDAGIVYETDARATQYADLVRVIEIPPEFNPVARYPIAAMVGSSQPELALEFIEFTRGDVGQGILREYGFAPVGE